LTIVIDSNGRILINGRDLMIEIINGLVSTERNVLGGMRWLSFNVRSMESRIGQDFELVVKNILELRAKNDHDKAIEYSDRLFESLTAAMRILLDEGRYDDLMDLWLWSISFVKRTENRLKPTSGLVHKGTAYYFLGVSRLLAKDFDGSFLSFAEAAKEDDLLPEHILNRHSGNIPPAVKMMFLDKGADNFALDIIVQIQNAVDNLQLNYKKIGRPGKFLDSVRKAYDKGKLDRIVLMEISFTIYKAFYFELWKTRGGVRPTSISVNQAGNILLNISRSIEDTVRAYNRLGASTKIFDFVHDTWFIHENWSSISRYENNVNGLIEDFLNDVWKLSLDGRNMVLTLKARNAIAHRIHNEPLMFEKFEELLMAMISSLSFVCDNL